MSDEIEEFDEDDDGDFTVDGEFSWNELITSDVPAAKKFYGELFGWTAEPFDEEGKYLVFKNGDETVAGLMQAPEPNIPTRWISYVTVDDAEVSAALAVGQGGELLAGPMDIPDVGKIAVLKDPQGAVFGLYQPLV